MTNEEALTYLITELQNMEDENLKPNPKEKMKKDVYRISIAVRELLGSNRASNNRNFFPLFSFFLRNRVTF